MENADFLGILPALLAIASAVAVLAIDLLFPKEGVRSRLDWVTYLGLGVAFYLVLSDQRTTPPDPAFSGSILPDTLGQFVTIAVLAAAALAILQAPSYIQQRGVYRAEYYALVLFATAGMIFLSQANELITMFLAVELLSLSIYVLVGITRRDPRSNEAAIKYFVQGAFATGLLLYGMALVYGATGSVHLDAIGAFVSKQGGAGPMLLAGIGLMVAGFAFKVGAAPFHLWVPDVYEGAPTTVTAFMSVSVKAAGIGALARVLVSSFGAAASDWTPILWALAAVTMVAGNLGALGQRSVKRMLAFSSVAHTGYALVGLTAAGATPQMAQSALFYVFVYTFMTLGAFAFIAWIGRPPSPAHPYGRDAEDISDYAGLARQRPFAAALMTVLMLSLAGIPPTAGFIGKFTLFKGAIDADFIWLAVIGILTSVVSLYYYLRVVVAMYMQEPEARSDQAPPPAPDFNIGLSVALCAAMVVYFGIFPDKYLQLAAKAIEAIRTVAP